jgi:hypothetical protein
MDFIMSNDTIGVNDMLDRMCKETVAVYFKTASSICVDGLRKITGNLGQDIHLRAGVSNPYPPE